MVYKRKSVSKMAAAAAAAAWAHEREGTGTNSFAAVDAVVVAVHEVIPDKAPAYAAVVAKGEGGSDALCTAIAAGVAAAAVGWEFEDVKTVSRAASKAFTDNADKPPAAIAKDVAEAVREVSSRYPAVEAAAAAAYAAYVSEHPVTSGSVAPAHGAAGGGARGGAGGDALGTSSSARRIVEDGAAIAAANAAGEAAKADGRPDRPSYAATVAARAATFRGASPRSVFIAAVDAATPTNATTTNATTTNATTTNATTTNATTTNATTTNATTTNATTANATTVNATTANARASADLPELAEHVAIAITAASYADKLASPSLGACGKEMLEMIPHSHELIYGKLGTIVALDTFLAAFLLFSLTGRKQAEGTAESEEVVQTVLQAYSFAVFLAATISAGLFMVVTGGTYALSKNDLIIPTLLSTLGFGLLLVTVADAVYLELGEGVYHDDDHAGLFWTTVIIGFLIQVGTIFFGVFCALRGSKYTWHCSFTAWPRAKRVEHSRKGIFSGCFGLE